MTPHDKRTLIVSFVLIQLAFFTYINFVAYKPKVLRQLSEVKGATSETDILPYPQGSNKISSDTTSNTKVTTVEVKKTPSDVQYFYKNVLMSQTWEVESESTSSVKYKKNGKFIVVTTAPQGDTGTVLSIESSK